MRLHVASNPHQKPLPTGRHGAHRASGAIDLEAMSHEPVLLPELVSLLAPEAGQTAVDCTFGAGGHARAVAEHLGPEGMLIAIDRDPAAAERFAQFATEVPCRTRFLNLNFAEGLGALDGEGLRPEMIYVDLGMSSMQVDAWERGFSYSYDAPLDMRMDTRQSFTAADLLNEWPEARISQAAPSRMA
jgi:16S rRNA (cytosine1402-N4)-methyltransferase